MPGGLTDERCSICHVCICASSAAESSCRRASVQQLHGSKERPCALSVLYPSVSEALSWCYSSVGVRASPAIGRPSQVFSRFPPCGAAPLDEPSSQGLETRTAEPGGALLLHLGARCSGLGLPAAEGHSKFIVKLRSCKSSARIIGAALD